jgi:hypothetical protein
MPITQGVGVVSTITFKGRLVENFKKGVRDGNNPGATVHYADPQESLGYDEGALGKAVLGLNGDPSVGVIVTVGGVASAIAAKNNATKPFLSVFGFAPDFTGTDNFWGGIDLATIKGNPIRVDFLCSKLGIKPQEVCLLSNPDNTFWTPDEVAAWTGGSIINARDLSPGDPKPFKKPFSDFNQDGNLRAMVVSGSPSFQDHKDAIKGEAKTYLKHVCYPFHIYAEGNVAPNPGYYTLYGPKLATAYYDLGTKVGYVLANSKASSPLISTADMGDPYPP